MELKYKRNSNYANPRKESNQIIRDSKEENDVQKDEIENYRNPEAEKKK